jgi:hypothetical protein
VDNDYLELPKMPLVSLLRWLAFLEVAIGTAAVAATAIVFYKGVGTAAVVLTGIKWVGFISVLLYSLSYVSPKVTEMKTVFTISVQQLLRYAIVGLLVLGLAELVLNSLSSISISASFITSLFAGILSTATFSVIFYSVYLLIQSKKSPEPRKPAPPKKAAKSPIDNSDWVDNLLKDVDKPSNS